MQRHALSLSLSLGVCVYVWRKKNLTVCSPPRLLGGRFCLSSCVLRWWQGWGLFRKYILPPRRVVWYTPSSRPSKVPGCSHWENRTEKKPHATTNTKRYFAKQVTVWIFAFFCCFVFVCFSYFYLNFLVRYHTGSSWGKKIKHGTTAVAATHKNTHTQRNACAGMHWKGSSARNVAEEREHG